MEQADVFFDRIGKALIACVQARECVPMDWNDDNQDRMRQHIALAMGLLQPPGATVGVFGDPQTEQLSTAAGDIKPDSTLDCERRVRALPIRVAAYAILGQTVVKNLKRLLNTYDAQRYEANLPPEIRKQLDAAAECFRAIDDAVGDDGVYPWL